MKRQRGLGALFALIVVVILAALAAAIVSLGVTQQLTSAQDVLSSRAWQAARAGNEWGLYQALKGGWAGCSGASTTLDLTADTGFHVTVSCQSRLYNEGESVPGTAQTVRIYEIKAVACPVNGCPSAAAGTVAGTAYIERSRVVVAAQ